MASPVLKGALTVLLCIAFGLATWGGWTLGSAWTLIGVVVSGFLWLLASLVPMWLGTNDFNIAAIFNSGAAAAAVFAGLTALTVAQIQNSGKLSSPDVMKQWSGNHAAAAPIPLSYRRIPPGTSATH